MALEKGDTNNRGYENRQDYNDNKNQGRIVEHVKNLSMLFW
jgi:hypothetical protein